MLRTLHPQLSVVRRAALTAVVASALAHPGSAHAQPMRVTVHGVAFDSIASRPLVEAFVTLDGTRSTSTDARGRFEFGDVAPGRHAVAVQHAALDSLGFTGITTDAVVSDGRADIHVATPSFATFWRRMCGSERVPADSAIVFGTVGAVGGAAAGRAFAGADVELLWTQLAVVNKRDVMQQQWRGQARTGASGAYVICGVPTDVALRLQATSDSSASGVVDIAPPFPRVQRRDLLVSRVVADGGPAAERGSRGTILGSVADSSGRPFANARIVMDDVPETRARDDGTFILRDVPPGTRQVEVLGIGMSPVVLSINVLPGDTATVKATLRKLTTLDVVRVTASRRTRMFVEEFENRRRSGFGRYADSSTIGNKGTLNAVFAEFPSVNVEGQRPFVLTLPGRLGGRCLATLWVDGVPQYRPEDYDQLTTIRPEDIAAIEIYARNNQLPPRFSARDGSCGAVVVWTKWMIQ